MMLVFVVVGNPSTTKRKGQQPTPMSAPTALQGGVTRPPLRFGGKKSACIRPVELLLGLVGPEWRERGGRQTEQPTRQTDYLSLLSYHRPYRSVRGLGCIYIYSRSCRSHRTVTSPKRAQITRRSYPIRVPSACKPGHTHARTHMMT